MAIQFRRFTMFWVYCFLLILTCSSCGLSFPHRFRLLPRHSGRGDQTPQQNYAICANITDTFLHQIKEDDKNSSSGQRIFAEISAQGISTGLAVKCLALVISTRDLVVERKCLRAILPIGGLHNHSQLNLSIDWPQQHHRSAEEQQQENVTFDVNDWHGQQRQDANDSRSSPVVLIQLPIFRHPPPGNTRQSFPCIFPIDNRVANRLARNGTVCGFSDVSSNDSTDNATTMGESGRRHRSIVCHPVEFNASSLEVNPPHHFLPSSSLFLFNADGLLHAVGENAAGQTTEWQTIDQDNCHLLANSSGGRVRCVQQNVGMLGEMATQAAEQNTKSSSTTTPKYMLSSTATTTTAQPTTTSLSDEALAAVPLMVMSVLVISGMLATICYFLVQKHRQIYYDTI